MQALTEEEQAVLTSTLERLTGFFESWEDIDG